MKSRSTMILLPITFISVVFLSLTCATAFAAPKVVGTCKVQVEGPHPLTITGQSYEGDVPEGTYQSFANTRAWALKQADVYRQSSKTLGDQFAKMADTLSGGLTIGCVTKIAQVRLAAYDGTANPADYPSGPKVYRLVGSNMRDRKSGDMAASVVIWDNSTPAPLLEPIEGGELKIMQNDGDKLVGTFNFRAGKLTTVSGSFDFTRPKMK
jgi:hypothetical protein